ASAPEAAATAFGFGHPSRGRTIRMFESPQFIIARAAAPMFSPICGSTRMMVGSGTAPSGTPPGRATWSVFQHDALVREIFADAVGLGEVLGLAGGETRGDLRFDVRGARPIRSTDAALEPGLR